MSASFIEDSDWEAIEKQAIRITRFQPCAEIKDGKVSAWEPFYALIHITGVGLTPNSVGAVLYEVDFRHLWEAFMERGISSDEEVIAFWLKHNLDGFDDIIASFIPRLAFMVCKAGAFELLTNPHFRPDLGGEARYLAERAIVSWPKGMLGS